MLDLESISAPGAAAMLGYSLADASSAIAELADNEWLDATSEMRLRAGGGRWLAAQRTQFDETEVEAMTLNLARNLLEVITAAAGDTTTLATLAADRHDEIVAALNSTLQRGEPQLAVQLALAAWSLARNVIDPEWRRSLARAGEEAAIASRQPAALAELLVRSAEVYADSGDRKAAERQWVRALAMADDMNDRERFADLLLVLSQLYRDWGRIHKALDVLQELVAERERTDSPPVELAEALAAAGSTMLDAKRPTSAINLLSRADDVIASIDDRDDNISRTHAAILVDLGTAWQEQHSFSTASRIYSRALTMLVDVDDATADLVRTLLADASQAAKLSPTLSPAEG
jgi:tetratricopeptide (TPR) repeat protein